MAASTTRELDVNMSPQLCMAPGFNHRPTAASHGAWVQPQADRASSARCSACARCVSALPAAGASNPIRPASLLARVGLSLLPLLTPIPHATPSSRAIVTCCCSSGQAATLAAGARERTGAPTPVPAASLIAVHLIGRLPLLTPISHATPSSRAIVACCLLPSTHSSFISSELNPAELICTCKGYKVSSNCSHTIAVTALFITDAQCVSGWKSWTTRTTRTTRALRPIGHDDLQPRARTPPLPIGRC